MSIDVLEPRVAIAALRCTAVVCLRSPTRRSQRPATRLPKRAIARFSTTDMRRVPRHGTVGDANAVPGHPTDP